MGGGKVQRGKRCEAEPGEARVRDEARRRPDVVDRWTTKHAAVAVVVVWALIDSSHASFLSSTQ